MSGVKLGGRESDLTIPECGLAIMLTLYVAVLYVYTSFVLRYAHSHDPHATVPIQLYRLMATLRIIHVQYRSCNTTPEDALIADAQLA